MEKRRNIHHRKKFLNKGPYHSDANIFGNIYLYEADEYTELSATLRIKDCNESISLAIDTMKAAKFKNTLAKLDILITELQLFKESCVTGRQLYLEAVDRVKQRKKAVNEKNKRPVPVRKRATRGTVPPGDAAFQRVRARVRGNS